MKLDGKLGEAIRFGMVGAFATAFHYALYLAFLYLFKQKFGWSDPAGWAYAIGYVLSFVANFYLTAYFTFGSSPSWRKLIGMSGAHVVNFLLHMGLLKLFIWTGIPEAVAPVPVFAIAVPVNFLLVRFVFKKKI